MKTRYTIGLLAGVMLLTGCVTGSRDIDLAAPEYQSNKQMEGLVYIGNIEDSRKFEAKPSNPSTPSVKGNLASASKDKLSTLIGRQRNGFGKAMGDVTLPAGMTVQDEMRELLTQGLESRGYTVTDDENAPIKLNVDIDKFWAWFSPGMWAVSFEANLACGLDLVSNDGTKKLDVVGYGLNKGQIASDANWQLAYERAFSDFLKNLDKALDKANL